jgi:hypothetical protein
MARLTNQGHRKSKQATKSFGKSGVVCLCGLCCFSSGIKGCLTDKPASGRVPGPLGRGCLPTRLGDTGRRKTPGQGSQPGLLTDQIRR